MNDFDIIKNVYTGTKVLVRSNDYNKSIWKGKIVDFWITPGINHKMIPVIENELKKRSNVCGIIIPYDEKLYNFLLTMENKEQWDILSKLKMFWGEMSYANID